MSAMERHGKIAAIVGMCGSGKSELTALFMRDGYERIYFGGVTMRELERRGLEKTESNEKAMREGLRAEHGPAAFAKLLVDDIAAASEKGRVVLDGLYSWSEYKLLKEIFGERLAVVAVVTDSGIRKQRLMSRTVRPLTPQQTESRDCSEIENIEKGGPIARADYYVVNNGGLEELERQYVQLRAKLEG